MGCATSKSNANSFLPEDANGIPHVFELKKLYSDNLEPNKVFLGRVSLLQCFNFATFQETVVGKRFFELFDEKKNGCVTFEDFCTGCSRILSRTARDRKRFFFNLLDVDGTGCITPANIESVMLACWTSAKARMSKWKGHKSCTQGVREELYCDTIGAVVTTAIAQIVDDMFENGKKSALSYTELCKWLARRGLEDSFGADSDEVSEKSKLEKPLSLQVKSPIKPSLGSQNSARRTVDDFLRDKVVVAAPQRKTESPPAVEPPRKVVVAAPQRKTESPPAVEPPPKVVVAAQRQPAVAREETFNQPDGVQESSELEITDMDREVEFVTEEESELGEDFSGSSEILEDDSELEAEKSDHDDWL